MLSCSPKPIFPFPQSPVLDRCTKNTRGRGRVIERTEYQSYIEQNKKNIEANPELYKKRQAIVEHPYGTIKRQWGFYYIMTKRSIKRASADVGMMFTCFNLRRLFNIIDKNVFFKYLKGLASIFRFSTTHFKAISRTLFSAAKIPLPHFIFFTCLPAGRNAG